jgi:hypothetical protein
MIRNLCGQLEQFSSFVKEKRIALLELGQSPLTIVDFEPLLPSGTPVARARLQKLLSSNKNGTHILGVKK